MRIKKSPIELINIYLLNTNTQYIQAEDRKGDTDIWFPEYEVDMDFTVQPEETNKNEIWIYVRIAINCADVPLPGYSVFVEGTGHFNCPPDSELIHYKKADFLNTSALSIVINYLRSAIIQITALGPFGSYVLPSIDLADLYHRKVEEIEAATPKKRRKKRTITHIEEVN